MERETREEKRTSLMSKILMAGAGAIVALGTGTSVATATEPCGDFGECKTLIEINAADGDIGFHFLMDGDDLTSATMKDPKGKKIFKDQAKGALKEQKLTETFAESAEPLCWADPEAEPGEVIVTLEEFLARWTPGTYVFTGKGSGGKSTGETELTYELPAAPADLMFAGGVISWSPGDDLGECASADDLDDLVADGVLPEHPEDVEVVSWEAVFEADDGSDLKFTIRVPVGQTSVTVPAEYLASLPDDTPAKIEVGAIGTTDNATFSEEGDICVNEVDGCDEEE